MKRHEVYAEGGFLRTDSYYELLVVDDAGKIHELAGPDSSCIMSAQTYGSFNDGDRVVVRGCHVESAR